MREKLKALFEQIFDYDIVGEYYDSDGHGHYRKKYNKKWHLRKWRIT